MIKINYHKLITKKLKYNFLIITFVKNILK